MKGTANNWIIREEKQTENTIRYRDKKGLLNHDYARFHVFVCKTCSRVYEQNPFLNEGAKIYFYQDFPTYKLERKECIFCKRENEAK